jgi:hypothetical protein
VNVFLDFEASSLNPDSYPIEVGWVMEDGREEDHLIRPAPTWTDWDARAEAIHGISRATLTAEGQPHDRVAHRLIEALTGHEVFVTAPSWDGKWMSLLLRAAGLPRHALRLKEADLAHLAAARQILDADHPADGRQIAIRLLAEARQRVAAGPPAHRALADARMELAVFLEIRRLARLYAPPPTP